MMFRFVVGVMRVGREEGNGTVAEGLPLWVVGITMVVVGTSGSVMVVLALTLDVVSALLKSSVVCVRKENCEGMLNVALLVADNVVSEKDEEVVKLGKTSEIVIMFDEVIVTVVILPELVTVLVPLDVVPDTIGELVVTVAVAVSLPVLVVWLSVTIGVDDVCVCVPVLVVLVSITSLVLELLPVGVVSVPELVGVVTMPDEVVVGNKSDVNELIRDDVKLLMTDVGSDSEIDSDSDSETEEAVVVGFTGLLVVVGNKSEVSELMMLVIGNERDKLGSELVVAVAGEAEVVGSSLALTLAVEVGNNTEVSESIMLDSGSDNDRLGAELLLAGAEVAESVAGSVVVAGILLLDVVVGKRSEVMGSRMLVSGSDSERPGSVVVLAASDVATEVVAGSDVGTDVVPASVVLGASLVLAVVVGRSIEVRGSRILVSGSDNENPSSELLLVAVLVAGSEVGAGVLVAGSEEVVAGSDVVEVGSSDVLVVEGASEIDVVVVLGSSADVRGSRMLVRGSDNDNPRPLSLEVVVGSGAEVVVSSRVDVVVGSRDEVVVGGSDEVVVASRDEVVVSGGSDEVVLSGNEDVEVSLGPKRGGRLMLKFKSRSNLFSSRNITRKAVRSHRNSDAYTQREMLTVQVSRINFL